MTFVRVVEINKKNFEQMNMYKLGYKFYVITEGESRSYFRTKKEAEEYKKSITEFI